MEELTPPVSKGEQLTRILRRQIFDGTFPADASGPRLAGQYGLSQPVVQRAFEVLAREGLLALESGKRTMVLQRQTWLVSFGARLPETDVHAAADIAAAFESACAEHPGTALRKAAPDGTWMELVLDIESADIGGAITAALPLARRAFGPLPISAEHASDPAIWP